MPRIVVFCGTRRSARSTVCSENLYERIETFALCIGTMVCVWERKGRSSPDVFPKTIRLKENIHDQDLCQDGPHGCRPCRASHERLRRRKRHLHGRSLGPQRPREGGSDACRRQDHGREGGFAQGSDGHRRSCHRTHSGRHRGRTVRGRRRRGRRDAHLRRHQGGRSRRAHLRGRRHPGLHEEARRQGCGRPARQGSQRRHSRDRRGQRRYYGGRQGRGDGQEGGPYRKTSCCENVRNFVSHGIIRAPDGFTYP